MERLTCKDEVGYYAPKNVTINCLKQRGELVDRLAAYEDTWLEPEEVKAKCAWADNVCKMLSCIFEDSGVFDFSHIKELITAEHEGRLVVLPCKLTEEEESFAKMVLSVIDNLDTVMLMFEGEKNIVRKGLLMLLNTRAKAEKAMEVSEDG